MPGGMLKLRFDWYINQSKLEHLSINALLYLQVRTRAVIGQFSGPYLLYGPLKFKVFFVAKLLVKQITVL